MKNKKKISEASTIRNALRPFYRAKKKRPYWKQIQHLRQSTPKSELGLLCSIVESQPHYPFEGLGNVFPRDRRKVPNLDIRWIEPLAFDKELAVQLARIAHHEEKIVEALESLSKINGAIIEENWRESATLTEAHKAEFGYSLSIVKKELVTALCEGGASAFARKYKSLIQDCDLGAWPLLCHFIYDQLDPAFDPDGSARVWMSICRDRRPSKSDWYVDVLESEIVGAPKSREAFSAAALRYSAVSLLDLTLLIWRGICASSNWSDLAFETSKKCPNVWRTLNEKFSHLELKIPSCYKISGKSSTDRDLYRLSFIFDEICSVTKWKVEVSQASLSFAFDQEALRKSGWPTPMPAELASAALAQGGDALPNIQLLRGWGARILGAGEHIGDLSFFIAITAAEYVKGANSNNSSIENIISVISTAEDIQDYMSKSELISVASSDVVDADILLSFLVQDLIFKKSRDPDSELERRAAFMDIFPAGRDTIVPYLNELKERHSAAALGLARTCTRSFLERLFLLMGSVKDVLETRLEICEWIKLNGKGNLQVTVEEADALERELANLDARSDLDSTRIHVDEESLREWYIETQVSLRKRYIQTVLAEGEASSYEPFLTFYSKLRDRGADGEEDFLKDAQIGSEFIIAEIVESTLRAFASDKSFGLDSYLSRRIRHGSLSGIILTPIDRILRKLFTGDLKDPAVQASLGEDALVVAEMLEAWRAALASEVDNARRNFIQIKTPQSPQGLISVNWRNSINLTHLDAMIAQVRQRVLDSNGEYDFFPEIYSLCWDILEVDLANLRLYMIRDFHRLVSASLNEGFEHLSYDQRIIARSYVNELQAIILARTQEICGWFIRPVFRRDKYNLKMLVTSTISITRELDLNCDFAEEIDIDEGISINRGGFEVIGDVLFVLIGNAAKHGQKGGLICVGASQFDGSVPLITLKVKSSVSSVEDFQLSRSRIRAAKDFKTQDDLSAASVGEGFSGIRKIISLIQRIRVDDLDFSVTSDESDLSFVFSVTIPSEITFRRERT